MNKFLWFDCETTGVVPGVNEIIQIAGQFVISGIVVDEFNIKMKPDRPDKVEAKALEVNGITVENLTNYPDRKIGYNKLLAMMDRHVDKFNRDDKLIPAGFNVGFDVDFLNAEFKGRGNNYLFSYLHGAKFDVLVMALMLEIKKGVSIFRPNRKLSTVARVMGVNLDNAHDALADIVATREVAQLLWKELTEVIQ